jgi:hypothetical protein
MLNVQVAGTGGCCRLRGWCFWKIPAPDVLIEADVIVFAEGLGSAVQQINLLYYEIAVVITGPAPGNEVPLVRIVNDPYWLDLTFGLLFFQVRVFDVQDSPVRDRVLNIGQVFDRARASNGIHDTDTVAELRGGLPFAGMEDRADLFQGGFRIPHHRRPQNGRPTTRAAPVHWPRLR